MFSSATQPPPRRPPPPPRHNFVVSAITFEGFKLRSSNLTHALFIQISRTSSITDIVVQFKMAAGGHFVWKIQKPTKISYRSEMARTVIESYCDRKWISDIQNGRRQPFCQKFPKTKSWVSIWNGQKCDRKSISDIQNGRRQPFCKIFPKK